MLTVRVAHDPALQRRFLEQDATVIATSCSFATVEGLDAVECSVDRNTPMKAVFDAYAKRMNLPLELFSFYHNGTLLDVEECVSSTAAQKTDTTGPVVTVLALTPAQPHRFCVTQATASQGTSLSTSGVEPTEVVEVSLLPFVSQTTLDTVLALVKSKLTVVGTESGNTVVVRIEIFDNEFDCYVLFNNLWQLFPSTHQPHIHKAHLLHKLRLVYVGPQGSPLSSEQGAHANTGTSTAGNKKESPLSMRARSSSGVGPAMGVEMMGMVRAPTHFMCPDHFGTNNSEELTRASSSIPTAGVPRPVRSTSDISARPFRVRVFLVRHGESEGNIDLNVYEGKPDHALDLTPKGRRMATEAGQFLKEYLLKQHGTKEQMGHHVRMWVSPYARTRQTAEQLLGVLNKPGEEYWVDSVRESPFLAEQDFGSFEGHGSRKATERYQEEFKRNLLKKDFQGQFWSRWPNGESCFDVCIRMAGVFSEITTGFMLPADHRSAIRTVIVVSHGVTIRAFLAAWCRYSPEWLAHTKNPMNCSINLVEDYRDYGCMFGGFDVPRGAPEEEMGRVSLDSCARPTDPRKESWKQYTREGKKGGAHYDPSNNPSSFA